MGAWFLTGCSESQRCPPQPHATGQKFLTWVQGHASGHPKSLETMCRSVCTQLCAAFWGERAPLLRFAKGPGTRRRLCVVALKVSKELRLTWPKFEGVPASEQHHPPSEQEARGAEACLEPRPAGQRWTPTTEDPSLSTVQRTQVVSQLQPQCAPPGVPAYWGRQAEWGVPGITGRVSQSLCPLPSWQTLSRAGVYPLDPGGEGRGGDIPPTST